MPQPNAEKIRIRITAPQPISTACFINPSLVFLLRNSSVKCILSFAARQRLGKHLPIVKSARNILEFLESYVCASPQLLLDNNWENTFPRQRRIVGGVVLYVTCIVSNKSKRVISRCHNFLFGFNICENVQVWKYSDCTRTPQGSLLRNGTAQTGDGRGIQGKQVHILTMYEARWIQSMISNRSMLSILLESIRISLQPKIQIGY
jgi:hypothetical protein